MDANKNGSIEAAQTRAVYDNLYGFYDFLGRSSQAFYHRDVERTRLTTRIPIAFLNVMYHVRFSPGLEGETIQDVIDLFAAGNVHEYTWWIGPELPGPELEADLNAAGLVRDDSAPGMFADLNAVPGILPLPEGTTLQPVETKAQLREWCQVLMDGFGAPQESAQEFYEVLAELGLKSPARYYTALWQGKPSACAMLLVTGSIAGIYCVATLPEARGKGLGSAVTLAALHDARTLGCTASILQASPMGYPVYQKLGFRKVCDMGEYHLKS
jgi:GNAT superfamily N-acetyltransferase